MRWKTEGLLGSIENCSPQGQTPTSARMRSGCGGRIRSRQGDGSLSAVRQRTVPLSDRAAPSEYRACLAPQKGEPRMLCFLMMLSITTGIILIDSALARGEGILWSTIMIHF